MKSVKIRSTDAPIHSVPELTVVLPRLGGFQSLLPLVSRCAGSAPTESIAQNTQNGDAQSLSLHELGELLPQVACNQRGQALEVVTQTEPLGARDYEAMVYREGKLPVRPGHVHDLFNLAMWCRWPRSKAALNALQVERGWQEGSRQRTAAGNAATLLDECGVVLLGEVSEIVSLLKAHRWDELFLTQRSRWDRSLWALTLGHGLLEQLCRPFDGLTSKCVVLPAGPVQSSADEPPACPDEPLARWISALNSTRQLLPLPVLGIPGWHEANEDPNYYQNTRYFRPLGRQQAKSGP